MYEPITVEIDRAHGEGNYRSYSLNFIGRLRACLSVSLAYVQQLDYPPQSRNA